MLAASRAHQLFPSAAVPRKGGPQTFDIGQGEVPSWRAAIVQTQYGPVLLHCTMTI
jgi:hypothetical protein